MQVHREKNNWKLATLKEVPFYLSCCFAIVLLCLLDTMDWRKIGPAHSAELWLNLAGSRKGTSATFGAVINRRTAPNTRLPELPWSLPAPSNFSTWVHNDCSWLWTKVDDVPSCWRQNVLILFVCHLFAHFNFCTIFSNWCGLIAPVISEMSQQGAGRWFQYIK